MKKIILPIIIACSSLIGFSQDTLEYANINNLDMLIANIFGIQCDGVSNVQMVSPGIAVGRFENGSEIGVKSGLVMSTGVLLNSGMPSSAFNSVNLGAPGDPDIDAYSAEQGLPWSSHDACVVEFDFTPSITDTIRFTYVFASEEYPEYVMQNYTDRFLFLISEDGGTYENIAKVPGADTTVEINTVNQYLNTQFFVDNTSGPTSGHFVFDGYTTPLEAQFYAQTGSTYHIKLVIADIQDGVFDSAIFLEEQESQNDIEGELTVNGAPADGVLEVFHFVQGDTSLVAPIKTVAVNNGTYLADSLPTGMYHVRFTPDPIAFPNTPPMYFVNANTWQSAQTIGLPCFLDEGDINSDALINPAGSGGIYGTINIDTTYLKSLTVPFENALIKLYDDQDELVAFTYSDAEGNYFFNQLNSGSFYIMLDVPYIPQEDIHTINLTEGQIISGADFVIENNEIVPVDNMTTIAAINENNSDIHISIFPNPVSNELNVNTSANQSFQIVDPQGRVAMSSKLNVGLNTINVHPLDKGIYLIVFETGTIQRFIKK